MQENADYRVLRTLDEPLRLLLWTVDEVTVFLMPMLALYALTNQLLLGMSVGSALLLGYKRLKGEERGCLQRWEYWHCPAYFRGRCVPSSFMRHYVG